LREAGTTQTARTFGTVDGAVHGDVIDLLAGRSATEEPAPGPIYTAADGSATAGRDPPALPRAAPGGAAARVYRTALPAATTANPRANPTCIHSAMRMSTGQPCADTAALAVPRTQAARG
jgi:hypothetical protein